MRTLEPSHSQSQDRDPASLAELNRATSKPTFRQHPLLRLQRTIGNCAVQRLIQAKLQVSQPGDVYERQAEQIARDVVTMPDTQAQAMPEERKSERLAPLSSETASLAQSDANSGTNVDVDEDIERQIGQSVGSGSPLPDHVRNFMEPRFGADFSGVRVHTGQTAIHMNEALSAQAFTVGSDIYYGAGKSPADSELTAHELTHVAQQGGAPTTSKQTQNDGNKNSPSSVHDGPAISEPGSANALTASGPGLSRQMIQRRGISITNGAIPVPAATNTVDGTKVVAKLDEMGKRLWKSFDGFRGTMVEHQVVNAFESSNLQPRSIAINFADDRGINKNWIGTVNIRMENPKPVGPAAAGKLTGSGGGTGTSGTTTGTTKTSGTSAKISGGGHEGAVGGEVGGETSTATTQGEAQGASGTATTGTEVPAQLQQYETTIIADIYLHFEVDYDGFWDYINPAKGAAKLTDMAYGANDISDAVDCGKWNYTASASIGTPPPTK